MEKTSRTHNKRPGAGNLTNSAQPKNEVVVLESNINTFFFYLCPRRVPGSCLRLLGMYYPEEVGPVVPVVLFLAEQVDLAERVKANLSSKQVSPVTPHSLQHKALWWQNSTQIQSTGRPVDSANPSVSKENNE